MRLELDWFSCLVGFLAFPLLCLFCFAAVLGWLIFSDFRLFPDEYSRSLED